MKSGLSFNDEGIFFQSGVKRRFSHKFAIIILLTFRLSSHIFSFELQNKALRLADKLEFL